MIISIDAEKAFDKIQHPFMIKTLQKMGTEGTYLNIVKAIYDKPTANIIPSGEKQSISPKIRNKARVFTFTTIIQYLSGNSSYSNQRRKRNKRNPDQKRSSHCMQVTWYCPWDFPGKSTGVGCHCLLRILYIENPKDGIRKFLVLISEFSKVTGYKISTQKLFAFVYANNEKSEREIKESIPFTIATTKKLNI